MSFNTKSKINIGAIEYKEIYKKYESYSKDKSYDHFFNNLNTTITTTLPGPEFQDLEVNPDSITI